MWLYENNRSRSMVLVDYQMSKRLYPNQLKQFKIIYITKNENDIKNISLILLPSVPIRPLYKEPIYNVKE